MQSYALTVDKFLDHAAKWCGARQVVTADGGRAVQRIGVRIDAMPLAATGKIDKNRLRADYVNGELVEERSAP